MTQEERRYYLIRALQEKMPNYADYQIPEDEQGQKDLLRALFNVRPPAPASPAFLKVQDAYLKARTEEKGITDSRTLAPVPANPQLVLWRGDITTLRCDTWQRMEAYRKTYGQDYEQPTAVPMITPGYNLPAKHVIHIVGPIVSPFLMQKHKDQLAACYLASLDLAAENGCANIAFCCLSTGVFMFPQGKAAEIAVAAEQWMKEHPSGGLKQVIFNVFKEDDLRIYQRLLCAADSDGFKKILVKRSGGEDM